MLRRALLLAVSALLTVPALAAASHVWSINGRAVHWASTTNPAQIELGDSLDDPVWNSLRNVPGLVWSATPKSGGGMTASPHVRLPVRPGGLASNEVEMYDGFYGRTGWIGQATLTSIDANGHIRDAYLQLNQSYSLTQSEKQATINHEVGHTIGLGHQTQTVMCPVLCGIQNPVQHDYDIVNFVNSHRDSYGTAAHSLQAPARAGATAKRRDGPRAVVFVTRLRDRTVRVRFRDYVSQLAADAALAR
jgi:hypothetical protein